MTGEGMMRMKERRRVKMVKARRRIGLLLHIREVLWVFFVNLLVICWSVTEAGDGTGKISVVHVVDGTTN